MVNIMSSGRIALLLLLFIVGLLSYMSAFIVDRTEVAIRFQFGAVKQVYKKEGLYFMTPFVNNVVKMDRRILTLDEQPAKFITGDQKVLFIDYFAKWKIVEPKRFYRKAQGGITYGNRILSGILNAALTKGMRKYNINQVITTRRREIMRSLVTEANLKLNGTTDSTNYGIKILDVRVKQIEFPRSIRQAIYNTMIAERTKRSTQHIEEGKAKAARIKTISDKEKRIILATANESALKIRGDGEAQSTKILANAHKRNPEFFYFYSHLKAVEKSFNGKKGVMLLGPDMELFKYFESSKPK